jgi:Sec-independent protein secretion pathway component TatC
MEIILLKLRIASQIGVGLFAATLIGDLAWNGRRIFAQGKRIAVPQSGGGFVRFITAFFFMTILGILGYLYAHEVLVPFLLEYLAEDASAAGLDSTWQLRSWIGFIIGLYMGSILSFQVPLVVVTLIRADVIDRRAVTENRAFLWFAAAVIGAFVSPPDPISMFLVGGPMLVLLEIALLFDRLGRD